MLKYISLFILFFASFANACEGQCAGGLVYEAYGEAKAKNLAVFVHGDVSSGGAADYMTSYARNFAQNNPNTVAIMLIRPGYYDSNNRTSDGSNNNRFDQYTSQNAAMISRAIAQLKAKYKATNVIALGHSGGAAMLSLVSGTSGGINGLVLVSCPCDLSAWRSGRRPMVASLSPIDYIAKAPTLLVTGSGDTNTAPALAEAYAAKSKRARVLIVSGGHNFNGELASTSIQSLSGMAR